MPTDEEVDQMIWQTDGSSEIEDELFNSFILAHNDNGPRVAKTRHLRLLKTEPVDDLFGDGGATKPGVE
jgi:hypothetical protein